MADGNSPRLLKIAGVAWRKGGAHQGAAYRRATGENHALVRPSPGCETALVKPYEELVQFIASLSPREVVDFKPSEPARQRVWELLERQKASPLPAEDKTEPTAQS